MAMSGRMFSWTIAALVAGIALLGSCRKPPNPFEPIVSTDAASAEGALGVTARPLTAMERDKTQASGTLLVTAASGDAAIAGIRVGDIIVTVNGTPVATARELKDAMRASGKVAALLIERGNAQIHIPVPTVRPGD
jgi:S1-C subfamily serine protease